LLLDQTNRHSRFQESDLKSENLVQAVDLKELKKQWLQARCRAEELFERLPEEELGCLYLNKDNAPVILPCLGFSSTTMKRVDRKDTRGGDE
jgi:hypothetical protein